MDFFRTSNSLLQWGRHTEFWVILPQKRLQLSVFMLIFGGASESKKVYISGLFPCNNRAAPSHTLPQKCIFGFKTREKCPKQVVFHRVNAKNFPLRSGSARKVRLQCPNTPKTPKKWFLRAAGRPQRRASPLNVNCFAKIVYIQPLPPDTSAYCYSAYRVISFPQNQVPTQVSDTHC